MKKFLSHTVTSFLLMLILAEVLLRALGFAGSALPKTYIDGEFRLKPNTTGTWIKGTSAEIKSRYQINNQGFNSIIDYSCEDTSKIYVALIGASYIEGLHTSVDSSIGRRIEEYMPEYGLEVHEYGISGWNAWNFLEVANDIQDKYRVIYIRILDKSLLGGAPTRHRVTPTSLLRRIYKASHFLRYIRINRGLIRSVENMGPKKIQSRLDKKKIPEYSLLSKFPDNCIFLYEDDRFDKNCVNKYTSILSIEHVLLPKDFGKQDSHWNNNGRENCARTIVKSLSEMIGIDER